MNNELPSLRRVETRRYNIGRAYGTIRSSRPKVYKKA